MNLFNPDRLITFPADDPQLVKQLQSGTKVYLAKSGDHRYADGWAFAKMAALIIALFLLLLTGVVSTSMGTVSVVVSRDDVLRHVVSGQCGA